MCIRDRGLQDVIYLEKILVFSGTSDGNRLAHCLAAAKIDITLCVATEYGEKSAPHCDGVTVLAGRRDAEEMRCV